MDRYAQGLGPLPIDLQERVEGLTCNTLVRIFARLGRGIALLAEHERDLLPPVRQTLTKVHPDTGRKESLPRATH